MKKIFVLMMLAVAILLLPHRAPAASGSETVVAWGEATVVGENMAAVRQAAIQDALRQAVEQGAGMIMKAVSTVTDDKLLEKIYTDTQGYVSGFKVVGEERSGTLCRVKVKATVKTGVLREKLLALGIIKPLSDYPRVLIMAYPGEARDANHRSAETVLAGQLTDRKYEVVDPEKSRQLHGEMAELLAVNVVENAAARIGLKHCAEIVLLYRLAADTSRHTFDGTMVSVPVTMQLKAVETTTAQILTAKVLVIRGLGETREQARHSGVVRAARALADQAMPRIESWWWDYTANGVPYTVTLKAPARAERTVIAFQEAIESIPGVVSLTERSTGGGVTEMEVRYKNTVGGNLRRQILKCTSRDGRFASLKTELAKGRFLVFSLL